MYKELDYSLTLSGSGETRVDAFNKMLSQIKAGIAKDFQQIVIRIEPRDIAVISAKETRYTERFFGIFFPRTRTKCEVTAKITVRLGLLDLEDVAFEEVTEQTSLLQKVLRLG